jgi:histidinol-phosphate aminotransferase
MDKMSEKPYFKKHLLNAKLYKGGNEREKSKGTKKIYKLSSNENILGPSPLALKAVEKALQDVNEYNFNFDTAFKNALVKHHKGLLVEDQFFTGNSGVEILEIIMRGLLDVGDECIISSPTFMPYVLLAAAQGAVVHDVPLLDPDYSWDVEGVLKKINSKTRLVFLTNPNNPTGTYIPKAQIDLFVSRIPDHIVIVYDEVYYQFTDGKDYTTGMYYVDKGYPFICVNSFSKAYGLAGMRIGYAYTTKVLGDYLNKVKRPFMINSLSTEAAIAALQDEEHIRKTVAYVRIGRQLLYETFNELSIQYWPSQTNFILFVPPVPEDEFTSFMLQEDIMVRPGSNFGAAGKIRVTIGTQDANEAFILALRKLLNNKKS